MMVDLKDGACRTCGGPLQIVDADDATMEVAVRNGRSHCTASIAAGFGSRNQAIWHLRDAKDRTQTRAPCTCVRGIFA